MINQAQFLRDYPEFADQQVYPPSAFNYWANLAGLLLNSDRWGTSAATPWPTVAPYPALTEFDVGCELFIAHNLTLEARAQAEAANGAPPGEATGMVSSKSVDKVSVSYDTSAAMEPDAGHWNLTTFGLRFRNLSQLYGAGPVQIGIGSCPAGSLYGPPYPGPPIDQGFGW